MKASGKGSAKAPVASISPLPVAVTISAPNGHESKKFGRGEGLKYRSSASQVMSKVDVNIDAF
jgi:hypothetical protein